MDIGNAIRQVRIGKKISQSELASMTGISSVTLSRIENYSKHKNKEENKSHARGIGKEVFDKIVKALQIDPAVLYILAIENEHTKDNKAKTAIEKVQELIEELYVKNDGPINET